VNPPEEDVDLLHHLSQKLLNLPLVIDDNFKVVPHAAPLLSGTQVTLENKLLEDKAIMDEIPASPSVKKLKSRKVKRDDKVQEAEVFKRSVICDDDEDSNEGRRTNLKRKRVIENSKPKRESIDFGPCASPPFKSRKIFSSKASKKSILSNSKVIDKHLAKSIVTCETTPVELEFCTWIKNFNRQLYINGEPINELWAASMTLEASPLAAAPYGFWRNDSSVFIATSNWMYLEGSAFNYSCYPINPNSKCGTNLNMPEMSTVSGMLVIQQCTMSIKIPAEIYNLQVEFCENVTLIHNIESDTISIKTMGQSCMVKIQEGDKIKNLWISEGSYRFFRQLSYIACIPQGNGLYTNCSNGELVPINALDMGYGEAVEVDAKMRSVGNNGLSIDTSGFSSLLGSKSKNIFLIVGIIVGVVILVTIVIIIICLLCNYCPKRAVVA
jgi:hypothetical protein